MNLKMKQADVSAGKSGRLQDRVMRELHRFPLRDMALTVILVAAANVIGGLFRLWNMQEANVVVVYILSVLLTARFTEGYLAGILASILSLLTFNWFFTEPYYTLKVKNPIYFITFCTMTMTAIVTSALTTKFKHAAAEARQKEAESNALYQLTNHLTDAEDLSAIAGIMVHTVSDILSCNAGCLCFNEAGEPEHTFLQQRDDGSLIRRELEQGGDLRRRIENLHMPFDLGKEFCDWPIYGRSSILGVLRIPQEVCEKLDEEQKRMLLAILESSALAMERFRSLQVQARSREEMEQERYRGNLLRAISHDIRTPLSGIMGTSEMLMGMTEPEDERYALAEDIYKEADWLHALVENILNLTRLQDGRLVLDKQPEAVEEVIGAAVRAMEKRVPEREISVEMPDTFLMVPMDARLIHQVLLNLLDNAVKHSESNTEIAVLVSLKEEEQQVSISVADRGCGIREADLPHVFQMFYTTRGKSADSRRGVGLGLSICRSIVQAHGGQIDAQNRPDGGAVFTFTLPLGGKA